MARLSYKYLPRRLEVLGRLQLRLSPPSALNDPLESQPSVRAAANAATLVRVMNETGYIGRELSESARDSFPRPFRRFWPLEAGATVLGWVAARAGFSKAVADKFNQLIGDTPGLEVVRQIASNGIAEAMEKLGVLSLSATPASILMWAHYADEGRGFVLGLDAAHPFFVDRRVDSPLGRLRRVRYFDVLPTVTFAHFYAHEPSLRIPFEPLLFRKHRRWSHELEERFVLPLELADDQYALQSGEIIHLANVPPDAVRQVVFGPRTPAEFVEQVRGVVASNPLLSHLHFQRAIFSRRRGAYLIEDA